MTLEEAGYVPNEGDIIEDSKTGDFKIVNNLDYFGENRYKGKLVGLSLERIEAEYITKDDANIREIMAYELGLTDGYNKWGIDERIKRDEKLKRMLKEYISSSYNASGDFTLGVYGSIDIVFAEVDKERDK